MPVRVDEVAHRLVTKLADFRQHRCGCFRRGTGIKNQNAIVGNDCHGVSAQPDVCVRSGGEEVYAFSNFLAGNLAIVFGFDCAAQKYKTQQNG
jgi:hypothetical protein